MILRAYLDYSQFSCKYDGSQASIAVQDKNTTVRRIVERMSSGVLNPDDLRLSNLTYSDFGLPKMDYFERVDYARANAENIKNMEESLKTPSESTPPESTPPESTPPESE